MLKIFAFFKRLFSKSFRYIQDYVKPAITVVECIKIAINNPLIPLLTAIIPGELDNLMVEKVKQYLPGILQTLKISDECARLTDPSEIIRCAILNLQRYDKNAQRAYYLSIAAMLTEALADGKLEWNEIIHLVQYKYQQQKQNN